MSNNLVNGVIFIIDETRRVGTMRLDWNGSNDTICNKWSSTSLLMKLKEESKVNMKLLQRELNYLQFELLSNFKKVEEYCNGTGYVNESVFTISLDNYNYAIKLLPVKEDYSYIYAYIK